METESREGLGVTGRTVNNGEQENYTIRSTAPPTLFQELLGLLSLVYILTNWGGCVSIHHWLPLFVMAHPGLEGLKAAVSAAAAAAQVPSGFA